MLGLQEEFRSRSLAAVTWQELCSGVIKHGLPENPPEKFDGLPRNLHGSIVDFPAWHV